MLIIEDELLLARQLINMLHLFEPDAELAGPLNSVEASVYWLANNPSPDLILMDIELADGQCFDIFEKVVIKSPVIFTTAYDEYALRAFKVNSIDYLMKPVKEEELLGALNKWKSIRAASAPQQTDDLNALIHELKRVNEVNGYRQRFLVKTGQKLVPVNSAEIAYFFARNSLTYLVTNRKQKFLVDYTLDEIEQSLDPSLFFRANRRFILSQPIILAIHPWFNGKMKVDTSIAIDEEIVVSREKAPLLKQWMGA
jgi:two-component system LytT family response regulator